MKIFKVTMDQSPTTFDLPRSAEILKVGEQHSIVTLWYVFDQDDDAKRGEKKKFKVHSIGTGQDFNSDVGAYLGTVQMPMTGLVWHLFLEEPNDD